MMTAVTKNIFFFSIAFGLLGTLIHLSCLQSHVQRHSGTTVVIEPRWPSQPQYGQSLLAFPVGQFVGIGIGLLVFRNPGAMREINSKGIFLRRHFWTARLMAVSGLIISFFPKPLQCIGLPLLLIGLSWLLVLGLTSILFRLVDANREKRAY